VIFAAELLECLTQPLFFLVLLELVERSLWDPLIRALRVPVRLPRLVWISSGCGSAVVRRSSRSLRGFGVSLPVAWSHPTLARCKAFYPADFFSASYPRYQNLLSWRSGHPSPNQFGAYHNVPYGGTYPSRSSPRFGMSVHSFRDSFQELAVLLF